MVSINEEKYIKVHVDLSGTGRQCRGESVWAEEVGPNLAKVDNIPFFALDVGMGDIIKFEEIDGIKEYIETVEKNSKTVGCILENATMDQWKSICEYLKSKDLPYESATLGLFAISFPIGSSEEVILQIVKDCPVDFEVCL